MLSFDIEKFVNKLKILPGENINLYLKDINELTYSECVYNSDRIDLNPKVVEYLDVEIKKIPVTRSIRIKLFVENKSDSDLIKAQKAIYNYYNQKYNDLVAERHKEDKHWKFRLVSGFLILASCNFISYLFSLMNYKPLANILQDSFEIMGWVAIWEPGTYFLYTRREKFPDLTDALQLEFCSVEYGN